MVIDKKSLEHTKKAAEKDNYAAYEVGEYYYTQRDYTQSVEWYKKAVRGNNPEPLALFSLGYVYLSVDCGPLD